MNRKGNYLCALGLSLVMFGTTVSAAPMPETPAAPETVETVGTAEAVPETPEAAEIPEATTAPETETAITETETAIPETETAIPEAETAIPAETQTEEIQAADALSVEAFSGLDGFVHRLYEITLQRTPSASERQDWVNRLQAGAFSGAEVAAGFFNSAEYQRRSKSDETYVTELYQAIMGRNPDASGYQDWVTRLGNGTSREYVLSGFTNSNEFERLCQSYGVTRGSYFYQEARDRNYQATCFIQRMYRTVMGRDGDEGGLNDWASYLLDSGGTGSGLAAAFFDANEYKRKNTSDSQYLSDLYQAIMGRTPDSSEISSWLGYLDDGMSRGGVLAGFTNSNEFGRLCSRYGISQGSYSSGESRDTNANVTAFVQRMYRNVLGRKGEAGELNDWTGRLLNGSCTGTDLAVGFILSNEYTRKTIALSDYVEMLYQTLLDRTADAAGKADWLSRVRTGELTPANLIGYFTGSAEFQRLCSRYGIQSGAGQATSGSMPGIVLYEPELAPVMLDYVNAARAEAGVGALTSTSYLEELALKRAKELAKDFSHNGAVTGENIAMASSFIASDSFAFQMWMNSDGHRNNILSASYSHMACARYQEGPIVYWVQVFD